MILWVVVFIVLYITIGLALFKFTRIGQEVVKEYYTDYEILGILLLLWPALVVRIIFTSILELIGKIASKIISKKEE